MEDYIASCELIENGIKVTFPENKFTDKPYLEVVYKIKNDGILCNNRYIPCKNFCKRVLIGIDIIIKLDQRNITTESLYNNGKPVPSFVSFMSRVKNNLSRSESLKEIELAKVCLEPETKICEEVENGYSLILDLYACEGIKC